MTKFIVGDVVRVKSKNDTGPSMTVEYVADSQVKTVWWNYDSQVFQRDEFLADVLKLTDPDTRVVEEDEVEIDLEQILDDVAVSINETFIEIENTVRSWFK